ncbi:unnamed protein product [Rotaria sp. Silwood1]|nr:unnamed protein product [Rotaria sp. Silwood1]
MSPNKDNIVDGKQVRFLLNHLINIHHNFIMETRYECSYSNFTQHIPCYIISPKPSYLGTCLCMTYLNTQLKSERISQLKNVNPLLNYLSSLLTNDLASIINDEKTVNEILEELHRRKAETFMITYVEWIKRKSERSSGLISTKTTITDKIEIFCTKFSEEITVSISQKGRTETTFIVVVDY